MSCCQLFRAHVFRWVAAIAVVGFGFISSAVSAQDTEQSKTADGVTVYIGIVPAAVVKGHRLDHAESQAHGGIPAGAREYHVVAAVFDATTGARIEDAKVTAHVASVGFGGTPTPMEPMRIADTVTYGNYFVLPARGPYSIFIEVDRPSGAVKMTFDYTRQ